MVSIFQFLKLKAIPVTAFISLLLTVGISPSDAGQLMNFKGVSPARIDLSKRKEVQLSWLQKTDCRMDVFICALNGSIVRTIYKNETGKAGGHSVTWEGLDDHGIQVPNGAYVPIVRVWTRDQGDDIYNPTKREWGRVVDPQDLAFDAERRQIRFRLDEPAMGMLRVGERDGGALYRTLFNWKPMHEGRHHVAWDGWDAGRMVHVARIEKVNIMLLAFSLPENAIVVTGSRSEGPFPKGSYPHFALRAPCCENTSHYAHYLSHLYNDLSIKVSPGAGGAGLAEDQPSIGKRTFAISVNSPHASRLIDQHGYEIYAFLDGVLAREIQRRSLPAAVEIDTTQYDNGEHVLTINILTAYGVVGSDSIRLNIQN